MIPKKVLVFGGTHGNEWTGVQVVKQYADHFKKKFPELALEFVLANPEAYKINRRFKDEDLNRAFQFLGEDRKDSYEHRRAKEIKSLIDAEECFIIDLHTTTANMGKTVILSDYHSVNLGMASKLIERFSDCRIIGAPDPHKKYLASQSLLGMIIEVGPVANSVLCAEVIEDTLLMLEFILTTLRDSAIATTGTVEMYEEVQDVFYPQGHDGEISGYIHSSLQNRDFFPLQGRYPGFTLFNGETKFHEHQEILYPIFINEAAYYPQKLAFSMCQKKKLTF